MLDPKLLQEDNNPFDTLFIQDMNALLDEVYLNDRIAKWQEDELSYLETFNQY